MILRSFCFCKKNQKAAARVATLPTPGDGSKLYTGVLFIEIETIRHLNSFQALNRCERETFNKTQNRVLRKSKLQCVLAAAGSRWKEKVYVIFVAVERENWCGLMEFEVNSKFVCMQKIGFLHTLTKLFSQNSFLFSQKTTSRQTPPFHETHNLLSTQIKLRLFINTHKSLRSKATVSHRFKILRAVWHKVANFRRNLLIGT